MTNSSAYEIETLVQAKLDQRWLNFGITVTRDAPHGIDDIRVQPATAPSVGAQNE